LVESYRFEKRSRQIQTRTLSLPILFNPKSKIQNPK
jgi:hypothetical protein